MTKVYNRKLKKIIEVKHFGENTLNKIYKSRFLKTITINPFISKLYGVYNSSLLSKYKINKFINDNNIDMSIYEDNNYKSFNDFFIRKLKKINIDKNKNHLISPAQGYLLAYKIKKDLKVEVKNNTYTLDELFSEEDLSSYKNGTILIFRLALNNYHRFHYIDDGERIKRRIIKGKLHTVSDSSKDYKIYKENQREYSVLKTKNFDNVIYMEVGALLVGKIVNYNYDTFTRGAEKGYFLPGGSTIILVLKDIKIDKDILKNSKENIETIVEVGERIGVL